jgi:hypothetical protein
MSLGSVEGGHDRGTRQRPIGHEPPTSSRHMGGAAGRSETGRELQPPAVPIVSDPDLPLRCHPAAIRASAGFTPYGADGAKGDRRSWSWLRGRPDGQYIYMSSCPSVRTRIRSNEYWTGVLSITLSWGFVGLHLRRTDGQEDIGRVCPSGGSVSFRRGDKCKEPLGRHRCGRRRHGKYASVACFLPIPQLV